MTTNDMSDTEMSDELPSLTYLHECFDYDPGTGVLTWKIRPQGHFLTVPVGKTWNTRFAGKPAGTLNNTGYLRVHVSGCRHLAHRIAYAMHHGIELTDLPDEIDHSDTDPSNNRADNLRPATHMQNQSNRHKPSNNTSGFKGVCWTKWGWQARIGTNGKQVYIGLFPSPELAHAAYCRFAEKLHSEFARVS